jgi:hypothetical protein
VIERLLFESPILLLPLVLIVLFILIVRWSRRRDRGSARAMTIGFIAAAMLLALPGLVVTRREQIIAECRELARAVDDGDVAAIDARLAEDFRIGDLDRAAVVGRLTDTLTRFRVDDPRLRRFEVSFPTPNTAVATFAASARVRSAESLYDRLPSRWRLTFRETEGWKVARLESLPVPPLNLPSVEAWLR